MLALAAAVLHAGWNLLLARARDVQAATAVVLGLSLVLFAPVAAVTWDVEWEVWPYALGSSVFELAYIALLAYAYTHAELSVVYPVARGLAPVFVLAATFGSVDGVAAAGVLLVALGVLFVRGVREPNRRALTLGLLIAGCIAAYTLFDNRGIEHADPFGYLELVIGVPGLAYLAWVWGRRGTSVLRAEVGPATVIAALASFGGTHSFCWPSTGRPPPRSQPYARRALSLRSRSPPSSSVNESAGRASPGPRSSQPGWRCYPSDTTFRAGSRWARGAHFL
jgi:hypothetical protein